MRIDAYTRIILTVIAVALVWLAVGASNLLPVAEAQDRSPQRVVIVGWESGGAGGSRPLPLPTEAVGWTDKNGLRHGFPPPQPIESARQFGAGLPTREER